MKIKQVLNAKRKIRNSKEYNRVFKNGKKFSGKFLKMHMLESPEKNGKIGIIISRKLKGAVIRNRYKRLLREVFRKNQVDFLEYRETVIVMYKHVEKACYAIMEDEIARIMIKAGFLKKKKEK